MSDELESPHEMEDEAPPVGGTWGRVYAFVLIYLAVVIAGFYFFEVHFAP